ncbi:ferric reductase NAD binding domain-containing protein [Sphaerosporella brunnea]|uniref:ferric-chelate reductase (NADPH) n=1 Tax=Sphaerosporella brunnea TaxID=1250544 RepID=A0A5J5ERH8_9PEZI|nr:ferric reductase NAD binding domain-containing protein [Sphaerosporella brunnea]
MDMSMGAGPMAVGGITIVSAPDLAKVYWMFAGGFIAVATLVNFKEEIEYRIRLREAKQARPDPARPKNLLSRVLATTTAITREFANYSILLLHSENPGWEDKLLKWFPRLSHLPPFGHLCLAASNLTLLLAIIFFGFNLRDYTAMTYQEIAVRAGYMTLAQLPLVFLMAGKANIVGRLTGTSYERLNWLHRSVARTMFITMLIHMSYYFRSWAQYDFIKRELEIDTLARRGLGAGCTFAWLVFSSLAPIRGWRYEFFVIQHMVSAIGFLVIVWYHIPRQVDIYVWFPVGLWATDRLVRWVFMVYHNISLFHRKQKSKGFASQSSVFACKAVFHQLADKTTRITIQDPPMNWKPGQHAFLSVHSLAPFQAHPFTISSLPSDGYLEFVVRAYAGCTSKFHDHACCLPPKSDKCKPVFLEGPYGRLRPLEQFDTVVLLSGSTGATFTVPLLRDLLRRHASQLPIVTRKIRFVWVVKSGGQVRWFSKTLGAALESANAENSRVTVEASIYVTCDPELTSGLEGDEKPSLGKDLSTLSLENIDEKKDSSTRIEAVAVDEKEEAAGHGPADTCCCRAVVDNEDAIEETIECCCCAKPLEEETELSSATSISSSSSINGNLQLPDSVNLLSGRPTVKNIVLKELEKARGESAVVVCGPRGLVQAARTAVVELSDERAVHKGTGAQGVCSLLSSHLITFLVLACG